MTIGSATTAVAAMQARYGLLDGLEFTRHQPDGLWPQCER